MKVTVESFCCSLACSRFYHQHVISTASTESNITDELRRRRRRTEGEERARGKEKKMSGFLSCDSSAKTAVVADSSLATVVELADIAVSTANSMPFAGSEVDAMMQEHTAATAVFVATTRTALAHRASKRSPLRRRCSPLRRRCLRRRRALRMHLACRFARVTRSPSCPRRPRPPPSPLARAWEVSPAP